MALFFRLPLATTALSTLALLLLGLCGASSQDQQQQLPNVDDVRRAASISGLHALRRPARLASSPLPAHNSSSSRLFRPVDFGADPTATRDASDGVQAALDAAFDEASNRLPPSSGHGAGPSLGSAVLDCRGGAFRISVTLNISQGGGDWSWSGGTLVAAGPFRGAHWLRPFQPDRNYLLEVSSLHGGSEGDAGFNSHEDTQIENLSVDCAFVTSGIRLAGVMRMRLSALYLVHFKQVGIFVTGDAGLTLSDFILGQRVWGEHKTELANGTAIDMDANDHKIHNGVVFASGIGMFNRGAGIHISGVHFTGESTKVLPDFKPDRAASRVIAELPDPIAYVAMGYGWQVTMVNNYFDGADVVLDTGVERCCLTTIEANEFYLSSVVTVANSAHQNITALVVSGNQFRHSLTQDFARRAATGLRPPTTTERIVERRWNQTLENVFTISDQANASFLSLDGNSVVADNVCTSQDAGSKSPGGRQCRSTRARRALRLTNATLWRVDFSDVLLHPFPISTVTYSVQATSGFPMHVLRSVGSTDEAMSRGKYEVVVELNRPTTATVTMSVDQSPSL
eukprot:COSAG05_NODE_452_length_9699_cov_33.848125_7_plen_569_part_00